MEKSYTEYNIFKIKKLLCLFYFGLAVILVSCGGGGSSPGAAISNPEFLSLGSVKTGSIGSDQSYFFQFNAKQGETYQLSLNSVSGDSDFALFSDNLFDESSVIIFSTSGFEKLETLFFTAEKTQTYYIEVKGFEAGDFNLDIRQTTPQAAGLTVTLDRVNFLGMRNQKIVQAKNINTLTQGPDDLIRVISSTNSSDWLSASTLNNSQVKLNITNAGLPSDVYRGAVRIYNINKSRTKVIFEEVQVSYTLLDTDIAATVAYNQTSQITVSSPDTVNPLDYSIVYGPSSLSIIDNQISLTPAMPLLSSNVDIMWQINISQNGEIYPLQGAQTIVNETLNKTIVRTGLRLPKGSGGMTIKDFDRDNKNEILVTNFVDLIYTLEFDGTRYVQDWVFSDDLKDGQESFINTIITYDIDNDGYDEILVGVRKTASEGKSVIYIIDGKTKRISRKKYVDGSGITSMRISDLDHDGNSELIFLISPDFYSNWSVSVYDLQTLNKIWQSEPEVYRENNLNSYQIKLGNAISIGNIDADSAEEIVTQSGAIYDGESFIKETQFGENAYLEGAVNVADYDGDGTDEIAIFPYASTSKLKIYDPDTDLFTEIDATIYNSDIQAFEHDNDTSTELLVVGARGGVNVISYSNGALTLENTLFSDDQTQEISVTFGDSDNDNQIEAVWAGREAIVVSDFAEDNNVEWQSNYQPTYRGSFNGGYLSRDSAGTKLIFSVENSSFGNETGPMLMYLNPDDGSLAYSSLIGSSSFSMPFSVVDYDKDGFNEILCAHKESADWMIGFLEPVSEVFEWNSPVDSTAIRVVGYGDINSDGYDDAITWNVNNKISVYDAITDTLLWQSDALGLNSAVLPEIIIEDLDNDTVPEIIALFVGDQSRVDSLFVFKRNVNDANYTQNAILNKYSNIIDVALLKDNSTYKIVTLSSVIDFTGSKSSTTTILRHYDINLVALNEISFPRFYPNAFYINNEFNESKYIISGLLNSNPTTKAVLGVNSNGKVLWKQNNLLGKSSIYSYDTKDSINMVDVNSDGKAELIYTSNTAFYYSN